MKKCSASHGQNNQLVHWWVLVHSGQKKEKGGVGGGGKARKEKYVCEDGKTKEGSQPGSENFFFIKTELHPTDETQNKFRWTGALVGGGARSLQPLRDYLSH